MTDSCFVTEPKKIGVLVFLIKSVKNVHNLIYPNCLMDLDIRKQYFEDKIFELYEQGEQRRKGAGGFQQSSI